MIVVAQQDIRCDMVLEHFAVDDQRFLGHEAALGFGGWREATVHWWLHHLLVEIIFDIVCAANDMHHGLWWCFYSGNLHIEFVLVGSLIVVVVDVVVVVVVLVVVEVAAVLCVIDVSHIVLVVHSIGGDL